MRSAVNLERLHQISLDDDDFLLELVQTYLEDAAEQCQALDQAAASENAVLLAERAHRIKGSASNVGAESLTRLSAELETAARNGQAHEELRQQIGRAHV